MKRKVRPNVVSGGTAVNLGDNLYYMKGKTHKQGGIDIGSNPKTGIEVENGEVVQINPNGLRVFSAQPILNGISPADALLMGGQPNKIFNAQEAWKQANHYNDDGTKFEVGGYTPSQEIIDYIKKTEGFRDKWYKDGNGIDTIGYGFTGSRIKKLYPNGITREQADKEFADSIAKRAAILQRDTPNWDSLTQNQRDALLSYHYNVGEGSYRNKHKNLQKALQEKDWDNVIANMDAGYNDKKNPGLKTRRDYERELFRSGSVTSLTGDEENAFQNWYSHFAAARRLNVDPDAKEHYYDYRGYWKNRSKQDKLNELIFDSHLPDTYKLPGHPTFSTDSKYSTKRTPGGTWRKTGLGPIYTEEFVDSPYTKKIKAYKNAFYAMGGEDEKFAVRDNTRTQFIPNIGYMPNTGNNIDRSNIRLDSGVTGYIPVVGDILQGGQALMDINDKNYRSAAISLGLMALPNVVEKPLKFAKNFAKSFITTVKSQRYLRKIDKSIDKLESINRTLTRSENKELKKLYDKLYHGPVGKSDILGLSYFQGASPQNAVLKGNTVKISEHGANKHIHTFSNRETARQIYEQIQGDAKKITSKGSAVQSVMSQIQRDAARVKPHGKVSLIGNYSLSTDSYPLYIKSLERYDRQGVGKMRPIYDKDVGTIRMIKLNKYGEKEGWEKTIDKVIDDLRTYTGNTEIPNRLTIGKHTFVPAVQFEKFKYGGIHIKPSKRGTFTAAAKRHHMSVQEFARKVLNNRANYSSAMVKKANFARNASKWHKKEFGGDMTKQFYITPNNIYKLGGDVRTKALLGTDKYQRYYDNGTVYYKIGDNVYNKEEFIRVAGINPSDIDNIQFEDLNYIPKYTRNSSNDVKIKPVETPSSEPKFYDTLAKVFPNPNFSLGIADKANPKLSELPGGTTSSTGNTPKNPYYSKFNVGLHKVGNYIKDNSDIIGLGVNLTGNLAASLINRSAIKRMKYVDAPIPISAQKLPTEVNIEPQVSSIRENVAGQERLIADNTADSRVALARRQRVRNQGVQQYQTLFGNKLNTELQLLTADRLNRQGVDAQNVTQYNQWRRGLYDFENRRREMFAENSVAGINNAAEAIAGERGYLARREARRQNLLNMGLIAATSPNAQNVIGSKEFEEFLRKIGYDGNFSLLRKRING